MYIIFSTISSIYKLGVMAILYTFNCPGNRYGILDLVVVALCSYSLLVHIAFRKNEVIPYVLTFKVKNQ